MSAKELATYIDQSVLKPEFTEEDIRRYIQEGVDFGCATVCINPSSLPIAAELTKGTNTGICVVCDADEANAPDGKEAMYVFFDQFQLTGEAGLCLAQDDVEPMRLRVG